MVRDPVLLGCLEVALREEGYTVAKVGSLGHALWQLFHYSPQLVIMEGEGAPLDGEYEAACRRLREVSRVPILTIVRRKEEKLRSLEVGADDSLLQPIDAEELVARVAALLRRTDRHTGEPRLSVYSASGIWINFETHEVSVRGRSVCLTPKEFSLLEQLVRHEGQILTHEQLLEAFSPTPSKATIGTLRQRISRLRSKIEVDPSLPSLIITHRGVGYSFSAGGE